jgi:hypothetical protein
MGSCLVIGTEIAHVSFQKVVVDMGTGGVPRAV